MRKFHFTLFMFTRSLFSRSRLALRHAAHFSSQAAQQMSPPVSASKPSRFKMRYLFGILAPMGGYYYWSTQVFNEVVEESNFLVSTDYKEAREIIYRAKIDKKTMERVIREAREKYPSGRVNPEEFGRFFKMATKSPFLDVWDILGSLRNSPIENGTVELKECLVAASMLVDTEDPTDRLELAWKAVHDADFVGFLHFHELSELLGRMERTGHILNRTLLRRTNYFPPEYGILDGEGVAQEFYKHLGIPREHDISVSTFAEAATNKTFKKTIGIWYMEKERLKPGQKTVENLDKIHKAYAEQTAEQSAPPSEESNKLKE